MEGNEEPEHVSEVFTNLPKLPTKSRVPPKKRPYPKRNVKGMTKCGKPCPAFPFIQYGKEVRIDKTSTWRLNKRLSCEIYNVIYLIECQKNVKIDTLGQLVGL